MNTIQLKWVKLSIISHFLWTYTKKIPKFIGRYFVTLVYVAIFINLVIEDRLTEELSWFGFFFVVAVTLLIDWLKTFFKPVSTDSDNLMDHKTGAIHIDRWYDGGVPGSSAYRTSHLGEKGY